MAKGDLVTAQVNNTNATPATALAAVVTAAQVIRTTLAEYPNQKCDVSPIQMAFNVTAGNFTAWATVTYISAA